MRRPPPFSDFVRYPVTAGTCLLAIGVTIGYLGGKIDIAPLVEDPHIGHGQLWRLLTASLPHANIFHILFNVYWTWVFGSVVEQTWGHLRTAMLFVILAVAANGAEWAVLEGGIGLSGIGYGLFGLLWVLTRRDRRFEDVVDDYTGWTFVVWFFICILGTWTGVMPVANIAHGVGALTGAAIGWTISVRGPKHRAGIAGIALFVAVVLTGDTVARPWVNLDKRRGMQEFNLGVDALTQDRNEEAYGWCRESVRMRPDDSGCWFNYGIACERTGRDDDAQAAFDRAVKIDPANPKYREAARDNSVRKGGG